MAQRVEILSESTVFKKFIFRIDEAHLRYERYSGGMSDKLVRLNFNRGDSVAALIHNTTDDTLVMTEQFRYPAYSKDPTQGWLLEIPAGVVEVNEEPEKTMHRELKEEVGYEVQALQPIRTFYVSPGGTSERIFLFYAAVTDNQSGGGGLRSEGEDIRTVTLTVEDALAKMNAGEIVDAKTIIALQWLALERQSS